VRAHVTEQRGGRQAVRVQRINQRPQRGGPLLLWLTREPPAMVRGGFVIGLTRQPHVREELTEGLRFVLGQRDTLEGKQDVAELVRKKL
jgi:hypothetical protein